MSNISYYIVDDQIDSIERLESLLKQCCNIQSLGSNTMPLLALEEIYNLKPQLVFVDVEMPELTGFELINRIREKGISPKFIFTTGYSQYAIKAIKAGAFDYLLKPIDLDELKQMLERRTNCNGLKTNFKGFDLSKREKEILELILQGNTSQQIADELFISKNTVDTHRRNILDKNNLKNMHELVLSFNSNS